MGAVIVALFATNVSADSFCGVDHFIEAHENHDSSAVAKSDRFTLNSDGTAVHEVILYVQPTYFAQHGEYEGTRRIRQMFDNHNAVYAEQGIDARVNLVTIVETQNVPDDLPFMSETENGSLVKRGAASTLSLVARNPGEVEYDIAEKWQADHVAYIREKRASDGAVAGIGSTGSGFFAWMDDGNVDLSGIVMSHEIGHNLRASHELENTPNYAIADAHAFRCNNRTTIMWSGSSASTSAPFYSDPERTLNGEICGDVDTANNLRVIKEGVVEASMWRSGVQSQGVVGFSETSYTVNEDNDLVVSLLRTGNVDKEASVRVYTESVSAVHGEDFFDVYQEALFLPGEETATVTIDIVQDVVTEDNEMFNLELLFPFALTVAEVSKVPVTLQSSVTTGYPGEFSVTATQSSEGGAIDVTVFRESGSAGDVVIELVSENGTAVSGEDYVLINESLLFLAGETSKTVGVQTVNDSTAEPTETFNVSISSGAQLDFGAQTAEVVLLDDDSTSPGRAIINGFVGSVTSVTEGGTVDIELGREIDYLGELAGTVDLTIGNSVLSTDFAFADGESVTVVSVEVPDNNVDQENYIATFSLTVTTVGGVASSGTLNFTVVDNDAPAAPPSNGGGDSGGGSMGLTVIALCLIAIIRRVRITIAYRNFS